MARWIMMMPDKSCPFLGTAEDPEIQYSYAHKTAVCYRCVPAARITAWHQEGYCLQDIHQTCPVFLSKGTGELPDGLTPLGRPRSLKFNRLVWLLPIFVLFFIGLIWVVISTTSAYPVGGKIIRSRTPTVTKTLNPSPTITLAPVTKTPEPSRTPTRSRVPTLTLTASPSPTATAAPGVRLYQVKDGDSLYVLADKYQTTLEAIKLVNFLPIPPLLIGQWIAMPEGQKDVNLIPVFEIIKVPQEVGVEVFAEQAGCDLGQFLYYNSLAGGSVLKEGLLVMVPRVRLPTVTPTR